MNKDLIRASDADFEEVTEETERLKKSTLPALNYELPRHPLMANEPLPVLQEELELDKMLGLKNQAKHTGEAALKVDIDLLTKSNDYHEISKKQLNKLFKLNEMNRMCTWVNIKTSIKAWCHEILAESHVGWGSFTIIGLVLFAATFFVWSSPGFKQNQEFSGFLAFCNVLSGMMGAGFFIGYIRNLYEDFSIVHTKIKTILKMESVKATNIRLPYGVKLKMLEAQKSGIFEDFSIANPEIVETLHERTYNLKLPSIDPAVLGVTRDNRMFMIAYWDIENDIDKTKESITKFERFKVG